MMAGHLDEHRWDSLWIAWGAKAPQGSFDELVSLYTEPHRRYHNVSHILAALNHFDSLKGLARRPELVEFSLWLHDAVYDPRATDNEAKSADLAERYLVATGLGHLVAEVRRLIMATAHTSPSVADDAGLVVDIDLSVLALHPAGYAEYTRAVRQEYQWVPDELFRAGRSKVLQSFLAMPQLYSHPTNIAAWEDMARKNIKSELRSLTPSSCVDVAP
jgi:predicted metal-dependent HD superfamily phosphohydrolase